MKGRTLSAIGAVVLAAACAHQPTERQPPAVSVPVPLIRDVCDRAHPEVASGHFDGHASLVWSNDGSRVLAIDCRFPVLLDGLQTTTVRVFLSNPTAQGLRDFLSRSSR